MRAAHDALTEITVDPVSRNSFTVLPDVRSRWSLESVRWIDLAKVLGFMGNRARLE